MTVDSRTKENHLVTGEPHIRFYAGAPLRAANGDVLGSLCVIDGKPRPEGLTPSQAEGLRSLARQVMSQMELRRAVLERDALLAEGRRAELRRNSLLSVGDQLRELNSIPEVTQTAAKIASQALSLVRAGFGRLDNKREFIEIETDWAAEGFESVAGRHRLADYGDLGETLASARTIAIEDVSTDPLTAPSHTALLRTGTRALANLPVRDRSGAISLFFAHSDQPRRWTAEDLTFLHNVGDRVAASVARIEAEALQRVLNLELSHRMKNMFAMVLAIAKQTLRSIPEQAPVEAFASRIMALSTAHDALVQQNWVAAKMGDVVKSVVQNVQPIERFSINGSNVDIGSRATLSISLLLHELSTNALKYGALSHLGGQVDISWKATADKLEFRWRENGGPPVIAPTRKGFGSRIISLGLIGTGEVTIRYAPGGLEADFGASLLELREA